MIIPRSHCLITAMLCLHLGTPAALAQPAKQAESIAKAIAGTWDMPLARQRPVWLVARQTDNPYPGYFVGDHSAGKIILEARVDPLTDEVKITSTGGFTAAITHAARKQGMEDLVVGGRWAAREAALKVEITEFLQLAYAPPADARRQPERVDVRGQFKGTMTALGKSTPIQGTAHLAFDRKRAQFNLDLTWTVTGETLGLPPAQAGPIDLRLRSRSPVAPAAPPMPPARR